MASGSNKNKTKPAKAAKKAPQEKSQKKVKSSGKSSCCSYFFGSLLILSAIGGLLAYDTHRNGGIFEKSAAGKFLKDSGALPYVEVAWFKSLSTSARAFQWTEAHLPTAVNVIRNYFRPYADFAEGLGAVAKKLMQNGWIFIKRYVATKTPAAKAYIEQYAPGLPQKISDTSIATWNFISSTSSTVYANSVDFFKTKVFVGNLSPENLSKAMNQTKVAVADYYSWFHKKVDIYAKIQ